MVMKTPDEYKKTLSSAYKSFNLALDEIRHSYPLYKLYQNNILYKKEYISDVENLEKIKNNIFVSKNNLLMDSETIKDNIMKKNDKITELNKENSILRKKLNTLENQNFAAGGELIDKEYIYNINLAENIILIVLIITCGAVYTLKK